MMKVEINGIIYVPKRTYEASLPATLAHALRKLRSGTLDEVANAVGISTTYLCQLEKGRATDPSFSIVVRLARHYGISLDELANAIAVPCPASPDPTPAAPIDTTGAE
jgi:transcriptional regulator with XRE-family HTH domain